MTLDPKWRHGVPVHSGDRPYGNTNCYRGNKDLRGVTPGVPSVWDQVTYDSPTVLRPTFYVGDFHSPLDQGLRDD